MEITQQMSASKELYALAAVGVLISTPAYAYIDPGTAGMVLQLLIGGIAGAAVVFRHRLQKLFSFFGRGNKKASQPPLSDKPDERGKPDV